MTTSRRDPLLGMVIDGQFRLESLLGRGGYGKVYRATQIQGVERTLAVKILDVMTMSPEEEAVLVPRFHREAEAMGRLNHPHTVAIYNFGEDVENGKLWLSMELLTGENLREFIRREAPIAPARAVKIVTQICRSLDDAHAHQIIHRDLKPANVFLCQYGTYVDWVRVLDFGIARFLDQDANVTSTGAGVGTPKYMAPEQCKSGGVVTGRTDLYALGCILYELITGAPPYRDGTHGELQNAHLHAPIPRVETDELTDHEGRVWSEVMFKLLAKHPAGRPDSALQMVELLEAALEKAAQPPAEAFSGEPGAGGSQDGEALSELASEPGEEGASALSSSTPGEDLEDGISGSAPAVSPPAADVATEIPSLAAATPGGASGPSPLKWIASALAIAGVALALQLFPSDPVDPPPPTDVVEDVASSADRTSLRALYIEELRLAPPPEDCALDTAEAITVLQSLVPDLVVGVERGRAVRVFATLKDAPALQAQAEDVMFQALASLRMMDVEAAIVRASDAASLCPVKWSAPVVVEGWARASSETPRLAIPVYERALRLPDLEANMKDDLHRRLVDLASSAPEDVIVYADRALGEEPSLPSRGWFLLRRGQAHLERGQSRGETEEPLASNVSLKAAQEDLKRAVEANADSPLAAESLLALSQLLYELEQPRAAGETCRAGLSGARAANRNDLIEAALARCLDAPASLLDPHHFPKVSVGALITERIKPTTKRELRHLWGMHKGELHDELQGAVPLEQQDLLPWLAVYGETVKVGDATFELRWRFVQDRLADVEVYTRPKTDEDQAQIRSLEQPAASGPTFSGPDPFSKLLHGDKARTLERWEDGGTRLEIRRGKRGRDVWVRWSSMSPTVRGDALWKGVEADRVLMHQARRALRDRDRLFDFKEVSAVKLKSAARRPGIGQAHLLLCEAYYRRWEPRERRKLRSHCEKAHETTSMNSVKKDSLLYLARAAMLEGKLDRAAEHVEAALAVPQAHASTEHLKVRVLAHFIHRKQGKAPKPVPSLIAQGVKRAACVRVLGEGGREGKFWEFVTKEFGYDSKAEMKKAVVAAGVSWAKTWEKKRAECMPSICRDPAASGCKSVASDQPDTGKLCVADSRREKSCKPCMKHSDCLTGFTWEF